MESRPATEARPETNGGELSPVQRGPRTREEVTASDWYRDLITPKLSPGDPAVDFSLPVLDSKHGLTSQTVRLSDYAGQRPVALIFGSYT